VVRPPPVSVTTAASTAGPPSHHKLLYRRTVGELEEGKGGGAERERGENLACVCVLFDVRQAYVSGCGTTCTTIINKRERGHSRRSSMIFLPRHPFTHKQSSHVLPQYCAQPLSVFGVLQAPLTARDTSRSTKVRRLQTAVIHLLFCSPAIRSSAPPLVSYYLHRLTLPTFASNALMSGRMGSG
jgi:hypothetical protein